MSDMCGIKYFAISGLRERGRFGVIGLHPMFMYYALSGLLVVFLGTEIGLLSNNSNNNLELVGNSSVLQKKFNPNV